MTKDFYITDNRIFDPLHQFIRFDELEKEVIDSLPFQRLHDIHQLGVTYQVYPGATHSRFEHSLGVMQLATSMFEILCKFLRPDIFLFVPRKGSQEYFYWKKVLRIAALCHDIGHLPFSHVAEHDLLGEKGHEKMLKKIIYSDHLLPILEKMTQREGYLPKEHKDDFVEDICNIATGNIQGSWQKIISEIIIADFFGADRIDYLLRDSLNTGVMYGSFDFHQLIEMLRILPLDKEQYCLGIDSKGMEACEALLLSRYFMYRRVYQHPAVVSYHFHLRRFMKEYFKDFDFDDVDQFLKISDADILCDMKKISFSKEHPQSLEARRVLFKEKRFKAIAVSEHVDFEQLQANIEEKGIDTDKIYFEVTKPFLSEKDLSFPVAKELFSVKPVEAFSEILSSIPSTSRNWIFVDPNFQSEVISIVESMSQEKVV